MVSQPNVLAQKQGILRLQKWIDSAQKPMDIAKKLNHYWTLKVIDHLPCKKKTDAGNTNTKKIFIFITKRKFLSDLWKVTMSLQRKQTIAVVIVEIVEDVGSVVR